MKENTLVIIHSFGDGHECSGVICGIAVDHVVRIYIVRIPSNNPWNHPYSCITVPESCLRMV